MGLIDGIWRAAGYFLAAWWITCMFKMGLFLRKEYWPKPKTLATVLAISGVLAYMSWSMLGEHFDDDDADPLGGPASLVADEDRPPPTPAQRNRAATTTFLLTFLPLVAGGLRKDGQAPEQNSRTTELQNGNEGRNPRGQV
jgi:hypothetical protein